jgi:hypothetical protein
MKTLAYDTEEYKCANRNTGEKESKNKAKEVHNLNIPVLIIV